MKIDRPACFLQAVFLCLLVGSVHAAVPVFGDGLRNVPTFAWAVVFALSTMSGVVALLNRVLKELRRTGEVRWPIVFAAAHMTGSWLAGLIAFLLGLSGGLSEWQTDLCIILASFGGSVFIEKMADRYLSSKLGYDTTAPVALSPPEDRAFEETRPSAPPTPPAPPAPAPRAAARPKPPIQPSLGSDFAPLDDG